MTPKTSGPDDQFLFLISCIKHSNNGKPDFGLVAQERGIISKGAAQKRFSRMMAAHGISGTLSGGQISPRKGPKSPPMTDDEQNERDQEIQEEEEEALATPSKKRKLRAQVPHKRSNKKVKAEPIPDGYEGSTKSEEAEEGD